MLVTPSTETGRQEIRENRKKEQKWKRKERLLLTIYLYITHGHIFHP